MTQFLSQPFHPKIILLMKSSHLILCLGLFSLFGLTPTFANDSLQFQLLWEQLTFPELPQTIVVDKLDRPYFYIANKSGGLKVFEVGDWGNPELVQSIGINAFDNLHVMNAAQQDNYLYLALGNFFGTNQQKAGIGIIDISNPEAITISDFWTTDTIVHGSAIVIADGDYAYLGAMNQGLMIFDISDKSNIQLTSQYLPDPNFPMENPGPVQEPNARGMAIDGNKLFLCYDAGGIRVIDISDKEHPTELANYINEDVLHKQQAYNNIVLHDNLAYVAVDYCGMEILDISNPLQISQIGWWNPYRCDSISNLWLNSEGHTNQLVYLENDQHVYLSAGGSELVVVDVSNPNEPISCGGFGAIGNQLGVWGVEVAQDKVLLSYINAFIPFAGTWSGIKILEKVDFVNPSREETPANFPIIINRVSPNPFIENIKINFTVIETSNLTFSLLDINGKVITKQQAVFQAGDSEFRLDIGHQPNGIYLLRIAGQNFEITKKMAKTK